MGNKLAVRNVESVACWTERIAACKNSGKNVSVWCEENGINPKTYYYWHNKLLKAERACSEPVKEMMQMCYSFLHCLDVVYNRISGIIPSDAYFPAV